MEILKCLNCGGQLNKIDFNEGKNIIKNQGLTLTKENLEILTNFLLQYKMEIWDCPYCDRIYPKIENEPIQQRWRNIQDLFTSHIPSTKFSIHFNDCFGKLVYTMTQKEYKQYLRDTKTTEERNKFINTIKDKSKIELLTIYNKYLDDCNGIRKTWNKTKILERIAKIEITEYKVREQFGHLWYFKFYPHEE